MCGVRVFQTHHTLIIFPTTGPRLVHYYLEDIRHGTVHEVVKEGVIVTLTVENLIQNLHDPGQLKHDDKVQWGTHQSDSDKCIVDNSTPNHIPLLLTGNYLCASIGHTGLFLCTQCRSYWGVSTCYYTMLFFLHHCYGHTVPEKN